MNACETPGCKNVVPKRKGHMGRPMRHCDSCREQRHGDKTRVSLARRAAFIKWGRASDALVERYFLVGPKKRPDMLILLKDAHDEMRRRLAEIG